MPHFNLQVSEFLNIFCNFNSNWKLVRTLFHSHYIGQHLVVKCYHEWNFVKVNTKRLQGRGSWKTFLNFEMNTLIQCCWGLRSLKHHPPNTNIFVNPSDTESNRYLEFYRYLDSENLSEKQGGKVSMKKWKICLWNIVSPYSFR